MKKFTSKVFAGVFAAAMVASATFVSASASNYVSDPKWNKPTTAEVGQDDVKKSLPSAKGGNAFLDVKTGVELTEKALQAIKDNESGITLSLDSGATVTVTAVQLNNLKSFSFALGVSEITGELDKDDDPTGDEVSIPANSILVKPDFGGNKFTADITIPLNAVSFKDAKKVKLYHCDGKGGVWEVKDGVKVSGNKVTLSIDHASYYIISDGEVEDANGKTPEVEKNNEGSGTGTGTGTDSGSTSPDTGVVLPIALVALAGGSVAVSAVAAKKRK